MKIEIMTDGNFKNFVKRNNIEANRIYKTHDGSKKSNLYFEIWEIEKSDVKNIEMSCMMEDVWMCYSKGVGGATPFEFLTIHGQFVIGWTAINNKDTFDCMTDYFKEGLGITDVNEMCAHSVTLAKTNGWTLNKTWRMLEG